MAIYFITAPTAELVKIGYSVDPAKRFKCLQAMSPIPLELEGAIIGGSDLERAIHTHLFAYHYRDEWFRRDIALRECVASLIAGTFNHADLPWRSAKRAWALAWRQSGNPISPNGRPYAKAHAIDVMTSGKVPVSAWIGFEPIQTQDAAA